jgi:hypothetical protein
MTKTAATPPQATPETTPVPGGGSWHWDYTQARWIENQPPAAAPAATQTNAPATQE